MCLSELNWGHCLSNNQALSEVFSWRNISHSRGIVVGMQTTQQWKNSGESTATLIQQQCIYKDLKTVNVEHILTLVL